ncbi:hypothetical protein LSAT2_025318 [Lamellibrachia satsuma]|nr:hypothetical protein LSAT2_025318 [Lamellibrachia satsuma]
MAKTYIGPQADADVGLISLPPSGRSSPDSGSASQEDGSDMSEDETYSDVVEIHHGNAMWLNASLLECLQLPHANKNNPVYQLLSDQLKKVKIVYPVENLDYVRSIRMQYSVEFTELVNYVQMMINTKMIGQSEVSITLSADIQERVDTLLRPRNFATKLMVPSLQGSVPLNMSRYNDDFAQNHFLGEGCYGKVFDAKNMLDKCDYAIKKIYICDTDTAKWIQILREVEILVKLSHKHIVRYHTVWLEHNNPYTASTDVYSVVKENDTRMIMRQVLDGVNYIHDQNIIHRDLKPDNIFLMAGDDIHVKIGDFGVSRFDTLNMPNASHQETTPGGGDRYTSGLGDILYVAPEQHQGSNYNIKKSCQYLGHKIDVEGIHPTKDKSLAIENALAPQNAHELHSFLGLIHYYHNFLRNLSIILAKLHELTCQNVKWEWGPRRKKTFEEANTLLSFSKVLVYYNPERPIIVSNDASSYRIATTTNATITKLQQTFAGLGLSNTILSDNGSCFTSDEFEQFCQANGIKHIKYSPYHPSNNGLAERGVQTVKAGLKKTHGNLEDGLYSFLARYRVIPQSTTGQTLSECVLKTSPCTCLDLLHPCVQNRVLQKQPYEKQRHDAHAVDHTFMAGNNC